MTRLLRTASILVSACLTAWLCVCTLPPAQLVTPVSEVTLTIPPPASPKTSYVVGDSVRLSLVISPCDNITELRIEVGTSVSSITTNICATTSFAHVPSMPGTFPVKVTLLSNGTVIDEATGELIVKGVGPRITNQSAALITRAPGQSCTLFVTATGTAPLEYRWFRNGAAITSSNNDSLILVSLDTSATGAYVCSVGNAWDTAASAPIQVQVASGTSPAAPANLTKNPVANGLLLTWDGAGGVDGYNLYRDTLAAAAVTTPLAQTTNTNYLDTTKGDFYYWVRSVKGGLLSEPSNVVFSGVAKPQWTVDTISLSMAEGDSADTSLQQLVTYADSRGKLSYKSVDSESRSAIRSDSVLVFRAMARDSGIQISKVIVTDGTNSDTCFVKATVSARYHTVTVDSPTNGSLALSPPGGRYRWGDSVTVTAVPGANQEFLSWITTDFTSINATVKIAVTKDMTIGARFGSVSCTSLSPGSSINQAIQNASKSTSTFTKLCPEPGLYDNNKIKVGGKVTIVIQK